MVGNVFDVSIDYLLKETALPTDENEDGYYVSKEMTEGFLLSSQKTANHVGLGFGLFALAFELYFIFGTSSLLGVLLIIIITTLEIISFVTLGFDQNQYSVVKKKCYWSLFACSYCYYSILISIADTQQKTYESYSF